MFVALESYISFPVWGCVYGAGWAWMGLDVAGWECMGLYGAVWGWMGTTQCISHDLFYSYIIFTQSLWALTVVYLITGLWCWWCVEGAPGSILAKGVSRRVTRGVEQAG